jgi:transposase
LPAKADTVKQRDFYESTLQPLMKKAKRKNSAHVLLFMDASHFVHGCDFLGGVYSKARRFVRTFSGRKRYNVLGAINFMTKRVHTVTNTTYITATEICQMLRKVSSEYAGKKIHIVLDNARYQKCEIVTSLAKELAIDLVYLPPYSPNLNLIERLWKFTKGKLRVKYYSNFKSFREAIDSIIDGTSTVFKDQVTSLIGEKIQLFDGLKLVCDNTLTVQKQVDNQAA